MDTEKTPCLVSKACWNRIGTSGSGTCPNLDEFFHCHNCPVYSQEGRKLFDREPVANYIQEWTDILTQEKDLEVVDTISVLVFRLGREWLSLKTSLFEQIVPSRSVHTIPHRSNAILLGLVNIRGELMLCASLAQVLNLETVDQRSLEHLIRTAPRMIVAGAGDDRWVFHVDEVDRIYHFPVSQMEAVPVTVAKSALAYSQGIFRLNGKRVAFLDERLIFSELKRSIRWQVTT